MKFFHQMANAHRKGNQIGTIKVYGIQCAFEKEAKGNIVEFFRKLYQ